MRPLTLLTVTLLLAGALSWAVALALAQPPVDLGQGPAAQPFTPLPGADKVAPTLWTATAGGRRAQALVVLAEQADLSEARRVPPGAARRRYVYDLLRSTALRTQAPLQAWLAAQGVRYRSHYLVNLVAVEADRPLLLALAARPDVARIAADPALPGVEALAAAAPAPAAVEWGVSFVRAPEVWAQYGVAGQGVVLGSQDTGVAWDHPALRGKYRGWQGGAVDHAYNWHDAIGPTPRCPDPTTPCDGLSIAHGTHTVGTMLGDDGQGNQIGVAPAARWIGCRNMDDGGWGRPSTYIECFEFLLAPYPFSGDPLLDGRPELGAHIVNNSWSCPPQEGCDVDTLRPIVEAVRAAGVLVVASVGNNGSACGSAIHPIGIYEASFSVGAVDSAGTLASFSSRGPVTRDGSGRLKPDLVAPGVAVRSAGHGSGYAVMSGTSMAAPHVAGAAALLWSADPTLIGRVDETEYLLTRTARAVRDLACGAANANGWPNNRFGWGYVDALAAVQAVREPARVTGRVHQTACAGRVVTPAEATVTLVRQRSGETYSAAATGGAFSLAVPYGAYTVTVALPAAGPVLTDTVYLLGNRESKLGFTVPREDLRCWFFPRSERAR
ncbi:MAG: S8 family serine peptidase [Caldilineales bacterium]|nr:S8 family serine peptidase [Caldilineales bacterium]MDW8319027.1 S8 family serine peptidase [Anaerolineae bacterium]